MSQLLSSRFRLFIAQAVIFLMSACTTPADKNPTATQADQKTKPNAPSQEQASDNKHFRFQDVKDLLSDEGLQLISYSTKSTNPNDPEAIWVSNYAKIQLAGGQIDYSALGVKSGVEFITLNYTGSGTQSDLKTIINLANKLLAATIQTKLSTVLEKRIRDKRQITQNEEPLGKGWIDLDVIKTGAELNIEMHISRSQMN